MTKKFGFQLRGATGSVTVSFQANEDPERWGYGILEGTTKHHPLRMPANLNDWLEVWTRIKAA